MSCETQPKRQSQLGRLGGCRGQKKHLWLKIGHFGQSVPENGPPNGHLPENRRYPELPQSMEKL